MDDREVIGRVLDGDREAYALLVDRYKDMAYTIAVRLLGDRSDAEEVVQQAFIKAYSNLGLFRQESAFFTWFFRIVYNGAISLLRTRKKIVPGDDQVLHGMATAEPDFFESEERDLRKNAVLWAITQISPEEKTIVTLFYHEERSLKEIGAIVGMKEDTVKMRLHRARKKMKKLLMKRYQGVFMNELL